MTDLMRYAAALEDAEKRSLPPVEKWNPEYCGEMNLVIRRDGTWMFEGSPIGRARLVRLFSTVIRKEGDRYFLVTPVEKLAITVEDAPFTAVLMHVDEVNGAPRLHFTTNVGDVVTAGPGHEIVFRPGPDGRDKAPYIHIRAGLEALVVRAVFYDLVALGETRDIDGEEWFGVWSSGQFFPFAPAQEIFGANPR
jgi:hypothetical protein